MQTDDATRRELGELVGEVAQDRASLAGILADLDVRRKPLQERVVSWGETVARLKPNGTVFRRSPLSDVVELESLGVALQAKKLGWLALRRLSEEDERLHTDQLDELIRRAADQQDRVEELRRQAVARTFVPAGWGRAAPGTTAT